MDRTDSKNTTGLHDLTPEHLRKVCGGNRSLTTTPNDDHSNSGAEPLGYYKIDLTKVRVSSY